MKTTIKIIIAALTLTAIWSACQMDLVNTTLSMVCLPVAVLALYHPKVNH